MHMRERRGDWVNKADGKRGRWRAARHPWVFFFRNVVPFSFLFFFSLCGSVARSVANSPTLGVGEGSRGVRRHQRSSKAWLTCGVVRPDTARRAPARSSARLMARVDRDWAGGRGEAPRDADRAGVGGRRAESTWARSEGTRRRTATVSNWGGGGVSTRAFRGRAGPQKGEPPLSSRGRGGRCRVSEAGHAHFF